MPIHKEHDDKLKRKPTEDKRKITRADFHALVKKSAQPVKQSSVSGEASTETSESPTCDDCNGTNTH